MNEDVSCGAGKVLLKIGKGNAGETLFVSLCFVLFFSIPDPGYGTGTNLFLPGSRILIKKCKYFNLKNSF
jgi:hypothetical protein